MRYAQIDLETGIVVSDSYLSDTVEAENLIQIEEGFDLRNKKYLNGEWVEYTPEPSEPTEEETKDDEISDTEIIQAEMLLNQESIIAKQMEHDEILAELLLGQQKGA